MKSRPIVLAIVLALVAPGGVALADDSGTMSEAVLDNTQRTDCRMWLKRFDRFRLEWPLEQTGSTIRCTTRVEDGGSARKGAKVELTAGVVDESGKMVAPVTKKARTDQSGQAIIEFPMPGFQKGLSVRARVDGRYRTWKKATTVVTDCAPAP